MNSPNFITSDPTMLGLLQMTEKISPTVVTVLIQHIGGPPGGGRHFERLASPIHFLCRYAERAHSLARHGQHVRNSQLG